MTVSEVKSSSEIVYGFKKPIVEKQGLLKVVDVVAASVTFKKTDGAINEKEENECEALVGKLQAYHDMVRKNPVHPGMTYVMIDLGFSKKAFMDSHPTFAIEDWNISCKR